VSVEGASPFLFLLQPSLLSTKHGVFASFLSVCVYIYICCVQWCLNIVEFGYLSCRLMFFKKVIPF
jgi:hypothetical protein